MREIDVILVSEELIELCLVGAMRPLDLAVQLRRSRLDAGVADTAVFDVPLEPGLELVTAVGSDRLYPEGKLLDDVIDEVDRGCLGLLGVGLQRADPGRVVDDRILEASDLLPGLAGKGQKLHIDLE